MRKLELLVLACITLSACSVSRVEPLSIPLQYKVNLNGTGAIGGLSCNSISQVQVDDVRTDKTLGVRVHESKPLTANVTATNDPTAWVQEGVRNVMSQNGLSAGSDGPRLIISVDSLRTAESIWHRSTYDARVVLTDRLQTVSGRTCWKETVQGAASTYGYSGSIENYQETLNRALDAATLHIVEPQGFKDALCRCQN
jgi:hypothetical protein